VANISHSLRWAIGYRTNGLGAVLYDLQVPSRARVMTNWIWGSTPQFSQDDRWLTWRPATQIIGIWDLKEDRERGLLKGHTWHAWAQRFSPDSRLLASGGADPDIRLWSMETLKEVRPPIKGHQTCLGRLLFSSDGKTLISDSEDMTVRWWNVETGQEMLLLKSAQIMANGTESWEEWNPGANTVLWWEPQGVIRITRLPTLAQIDQIEAERAASGVP
jgi:WD40 repeat protein